MSATRICPAGSTDAQGGDTGDHGDFGPPSTPEYTSQKNLVKIGHDPRTNTLLALRGMAGNFGEEPPTNPNLIRSKDCGKNWDQVTDLVADGVISSYNTGTGGNLDTMFHIPMIIVPGYAEGTWIIMDFVGGYYISLDDGNTWSDRLYGGIDGGIIVPDPESPFVHEYKGTLGIDGQFDTRPLPLHHYIEEQQLGFAYTISPIEGGWERIGVRRSLGVNGTTGWDTSLSHDPYADGGSGWVIGGSYPPLLGANGRWIIVADHWMLGTSGGPKTPNLRINTSTNLDPSSWQEPFYMIDEAYMQDIYQGAGINVPFGQGRFEFRQGHPRLKFFADSTHPVGGRWWFMGVNDCLLYSDDNGETWSNSLSDHTGAEENIHPILNWRNSNDLGYRATPCRILDIFQDPAVGDRLMSIGVTYDRAGITNRLAVFCCSEDRGETWGAVGQLPISLDNIQSTGTSAGFDSPAVARHIFPCMGGIG